jgi:hypothetical protein
MYAFEQDVPIDAGTYEKLLARIAEVSGDAAPSGALLHLAIEREDGHISYLDVWETKEDCDRFTENVLHKVIGPALAEAGIQVDSEPPRRSINVIDLFGPAFPRAV